MIQRHRIFFFILSNNILTIALLEQVVEQVIARSNTVWFYAAERIITLQFATHYVGQSLVQDEIISVDVLLSLPLQLQSLGVHE